MYKRACLFCKYISIYIYEYISESMNRYTCIHIQQVIEIIMGIGTTPISVNLFLHCYRSYWIRQMMNTVRANKKLFRFINRYY